ncbi:MAG: FHA domain-containing protein [Anaerolineales bacterium]|nr:FHA domain-containing protein [Chloroflexota bacterium]MBL6980037.1 FHA domain-containing protein [Anaerolineales bacterium]
MSQTTPADTMMYQRSKLIIAWPSGEQQTYTLEQEIVRIGRGKDNDIIPPGEYNSISRKHMEIRRDGAQYRVVDLGSRNGVLLNGNRVNQSSLLKDGDTIQIGLEKLGQLVQVTFHLGVEVLVEEQEPSSDVDEPTPISIQPHSPTDHPYLDVHWPNGQTGIFHISKDVILLGRSADCDLVIPSRLRFVSSKHAEIRCIDQGYTLTDLNSTNGTRLNDHLLEPGTPTPLTHENVIRIGDESFGVSIGMIFHNPTEFGIDVTGFSPTLAEPTMVTELREISIGRADDGDIVLSDADVSRQHARIRQLGDNYWIEDLGSTNGTFVNQQAITRVELLEGDQIQIGKNVLLFQNGLLTEYHSHGMRVDVTNLSKDVKTRSGPLRILHNIDMTILPREFIAVVGGSGAGKSTFMNALIGFKPGEGDVRLNGHDFYKEYEHFRHQLGYVPQSDILHSMLTVEKALDYAARLRLPSDISKAERSKRISEVLDTVSMNTDTIRSTRISNLSGGQRKRVSIAAELLADPKLIYLDEATSGLDPGLEKKMMYTLRRMADEGRTVILITHATDNIRQTDHVAFLSQGKLVYFGPSQDTLEFFEVDDFADIYQRIERHGDEWHRVFHKEKPQLHQQYIAERQHTKPTASKRQLPKIRFGLGDFLRQLNVLTQRAFSVLKSEWFTLVLMLLLFPLTATLQLIISTPDILNGDAGIMADPVAAAKTMSERYTPFADLNTFVFVMGLEAVLVGMYVPSNELIKERTIYLRERMVNLKVMPYLASKIAVFTIFAAIQTFLYLVVLSFGVNYPEQGLYLPAPVEFFITLFLTMLASMGVGFIVSAISKSSDMAIYVLVILLFFQFFFAGTVFDLRDNAAEPLSYLTATRWSLTALGVTIDMEEQVEATIVCSELPENPQAPQSQSGKTLCFNYPDATEDLMLSYDDDMLLQSWGVLIAMAVISLTITGILVKRLDRR